MKRRKTRKVRRVRRKRGLRRNAPRLNMYTPGEKYIGTFEIAKPNGDYDVWEVVRRGRVFVIGTATNTGLLSDYYFKMEQGESEQKALEEINADLEVLATDGAGYMSRVTAIPKRTKEASRQRADKRRNLRGNPSLYRKIDVYIVTPRGLEYWRSTNRFKSLKGAMQSAQDALPPGSKFKVQYADEPAYYDRGKFGPVRRQLRGNPFRVGGHLRETPEEAGYRVVQLKGKELILQDKSNGRFELYVKSRNFAGAAIYYKGNSYEFVSSR